MKESEAEKKKRQEWELANAEKLDYQDCQVPSPAAKKYAKETMKRLGLKPKARRVHTEESKLRGDFGQRTKIPESIIEQLNILLPFFYSIGDTDAISDLSRVIAEREAKAGDLNNFDVLPKMLEMSPALKPEWVKAAEVVAEFSRDK